MRIAYSALTVLARVVKRSEVCRLAVGDEVGQLLSYLWHLTINDTLCINCYSYTKSRSHQHIKIY